MNVADGSTEYAGDRSLVEVARESSSALRDTSRWLHRRVERIRYTERSMIQRRVSVDFTVPRELPAFHVGEPSTPNVYFVPVALLRKWPPLMDFDLRSEDGRPVPLLTSQKNREVDAAALVGLAPDGRERDCLQPLLEGVPKLDAARAGKALDAIGTFLDPRWDELPPEAQREWARTLRVAGSLVKNSLLWARVEAQPGQRHLIKFAFTEPAPRELLLSRRVLSSFSWAPRRAQYELPNLGERGSYHLEIEAPPDLAIYRAKLELSDLPPRARHVVRDHRGRRFLRWLKNIPRHLLEGARSRRKEFFGTVSDKERPPKPSHLKEVKPGEPYVWNTRERAYLYVVGGQDQYGVASVDMGIGNRGLITSSLRAANVITALLGFLWLARGSVVHHVDGAVTLLVVFPALLALLVVRPGEHPMMRQLIAGVRLLLVAVAVLPVFDAVLMLGFAHPRATDLGVPYLIGFLLGIAVSMLLLTSWLLPACEDEY